MLHYICTACGSRDMSGEFITQNIPIETVRSQLLALKAADGPELVTSPPAQSQPAISSTEKIYARRRKADPSGAQHHGTEKK